MNPNDGVTEVMQVNVDASGNLRATMPAEHYQMTCEVDGCARTDGKDYRRFPKGLGWDNEPIFLCPDHRHHAQEGEGA